MFKTIKLKDIFQGGLPCVVKSVTVETLGGTTLPCKYSNTEFTIQLDETGNYNCVNITIDCEDCNLCPSIVKQYCFCDNSLLLGCPDCHDCVLGNCVDRCPGKKCLNNQCVDCLINSDCRGGKICTPNGCVCPGGTYEDAGGTCRQCIVDGHCSNCEKCYGYTCVPKQCPGQYLSLVTCTCQNCTGSEHCGPNQVCDNGNCICAPSFIWDPVSRTCIGRPKCSTLIPCPDCYNCVSGDCQLTVCPSGHVNSGIPGKCCVKECDCTTRICAGLMSICVNYDINKCYCQDCGGFCDETHPCIGLGCTCNFKTKLCEKNPCDRPCSPANPCPQGCGCLNGRCVPCSFLLCTTSLCSNAVGCACNGLNVCEPAPCNGNCNNGAVDCLGLNCGCDDVTRKCVDCTKISCLNGVKCPLGCSCGLSGYCEKDPCDKPCLTAKDCGFGCGCDPATKRCKKCSSYLCTACLLVPGCNCNSGTCGHDIDGRDNCLDTARITKLSDCTLKGELLNLTNCCKCADITIGSTPTWSATTTIQIVAELHKGLLLTDPLLGNTSNATIADNEKPTSGKLRYTAEMVAYEINCGTLLGVVGAPTSLISKYVDLDVTELDTVTGQIINVTKPGSTFSEGGKCYKVESVRLYIETIENLKFTARSGCEYLIVKQIFTTASGTTLGATNIGTTTMTSLVECANPILTWYSGLVPTSMTRLKKAYSPLLGSSYVDILTPADGLLVCKYYRLVPECGCAVPVWSNCNGSSLTSGTKLIFCQPVDITVEMLDPCANSIKIKEVSVCGAMSTATYTLFINGVQEGLTFSPDVNNKLFTGDLIITKTYPIINVRLEVDCDECENCTIEKILTPSSDPCVCGNNDWTLTNVGSDCNNISVRIDGVTSALAGTAFAYSSQFGSGIGTMDLSNLGFVGIGGPHVSGTYIITVTINGCSKQISITLANCCELNPGAYTYACATKIITATVAATGNGVGPYTYQILLGVWTNLTLGVALANPLGNGTYQIKVTDSVTGCEGFYTLVVDCAGGYIDAIVDNVCSNADPSCPGFEITATGGNAPFSVYSSVDNGLNWVLRTSGLALNTPYQHTNCAYTAGQIITWKLEDSSAITQVLISSITIELCEVWNAIVNPVCVPQSGISIYFPEGGFYQITVDPDPTDGLGPAVTYPGTGWFNKSAGSSEFIPAVNETYSVSIKKQNGGTKVYSNIIVSCFAYSYTMGCGAGNWFKITRNGIPYDCFIRVNGAPTSAVLLSSLGDFFFEQGSSYTVSIYDPSNSTILLAQIPVIGLNCCFSGTIGSNCGVGSPPGEVHYSWVFNTVGDATDNFLYNYPSLIQVLPTKTTQAGTWTLLPDGQYRLYGFSTVVKKWVTDHVEFCSIQNLNADVRCDNNCLLTDSGMVHGTGILQDCGLGFGCKAVVTNSHSFNVLFQLESRPFNPEGNCNIALGIWTSVTNGVLTPGGIFEYCIADSTCYRMTYTRQGNSDPLCIVKKGFSCP